jgi:hypothetical protein
MTHFIFDWPMYRLFVLNTGWKRDSLKMMIFVNVCTTWSMVVQLITRFETWITRNDVNGVSWFHLSYLITLMSYLSSEWTPNVQIEYFMFHWSINTPFVLNRTWNRAFLQIMIFVNVYLTWGVVELKTRFETSITKNNVNGVSLLHLSHLIRLMA